MRRADEAEVVEKLIGFVQIEERIAYLRRFLSIFVCEFRVDLRCICVAFHLWLVWRLNLPLIQSFPINSLEKRVFLNLLVPTVPAPEPRSWLKID